MSPNPADGEVKDLVLKPGEKIEAKTRNGTIRIEADSFLDRTYTWDGESRSVTLWPRKKQRNGGYGAYYPGPGEHWKSVNGVTRGVLQESVLNFSSKKDAEDWIDRPWHKKTGAVYTNQGLFVLFSKELNRKQINVDLFRIRINGSEPETLSGANGSHSIFKTAD